jgi:uncharacterized protein
MTYLLRILLIVVVAWVIVRLWRHMRHTLPQQPGLGSEPLVRCEHCGTYVPRGTAIVSDEHVYCSAAHRNAARKET